MTIEELKQQYLNSSGAAKQAAYDKLDALGLMPCEKCEGRGCPNCFERGFFYSIVQNAGEDTDDVVGDSSNSGGVGDVAGMAVQVAFKPNKGPVNQGPSWATLLKAFGVVFMSLTMGMLLWVGLATVKDNAYLRGYHDGYTRGYDEGAAHCKMELKS